MRRTCWPSRTRSSSPATTPRARRRASPAGKIPRYEDNEQNFADLHARIAKTRDYLGTFTAADFEGAEERPILIKGRTRELNFTGLNYLRHFALPNFFFHVTTAYDILRHNGVTLSKVDFLRE